MTYELASLDEQGAWELIGDYATWDDAVQAAAEIAPHCHHDKGDVIFGVSKDPGSGHYEYGLTLRKDAGRYVVMS